MSSSTRGDSKDDVVFHIAEKSDWEKKAEYYKPSTLAEEGFIHLSTRAQLLATAQRYYAGRSDLILIAVQVSALSKPLVYENLLAKQELFPHLYGEIPRAAVLASGPLLMDSNGDFSSAVLDVVL